MRSANYKVLGESSKGKENIRLFPLDYNFDLSLFLRKRKRKENKSKTMLEIITNTRI